MVTCYKKPVAVQLGVGVREERASREKLDLKDKGSVKAIAQPDHVILCSICFVNPFILLCQQSLFV